ncbi:MAG: TIGR04063 family PEP-CTERM/XrtA system glycosyltransferase [Gammaproteobacteria bacterium]
MRILHVLDHSVPLHSGYTFRTLAILREQRARGWHTDHVTSSKQTGASEPVEEAEGLTFYRTFPASGLLSKLPVVNQWAVIRDLERRLDEIIPELKPDVLHAHSPALNGVAAVRAGRRHGIPVVYEVRAFWEDAAVDHGTTTEGSLRYRLTRGIETWVLKRAQAVTTIAEGLRGDMLARGIPATKVTQIPNAVDLARFDGTTTRDEELRRELGLDGCAVVGFIGSFYGYEGLGLLVDALPAMLAKRPDVRLLLVGGGFQEANLKAQVTRMGLEDKVIFTGRVPHEQVQRYYGQVDVLVYPRLSKRITELVTPLKPLEAMGEGRLMVASDVGGHKELIEDGKNGVLFRAGDASALADAVTGLLDAPERWAAIRAAGRDYVETERNWAAVVARYEDVYAAALGAA